MLSVIPGQGLTSPLRFVAVTQKISGVHGIEPAEELRSGVEVAVNNYIAKYVGAHPIRAGLHTTLIGTTEAITFNSVSIDKRGSLIVVLTASGKVSKPIYDLVKSESRKEA